MLTLHINGHDSGRDLDRWLVPSPTIPAIPPGGGMIDTQRFQTLLDGLTDRIEFANLPIPLYPWSYVAKRRAV